MKCYGGLLPEEIQCPNNDLMLLIILNTPNISHLLCHDNNDGIEFYNNNDISLNRRRR